MGLNLDPQFVRDLTILITASALAGVAAEALGQPTMSGYFLAGSLVGPGGLKLVKELVQVGDAWVGWGPAFYRWQRSVFGWRVLADRR